MRWEMEWKGTGPRWTGDLDTDQESFQRFIVGVFRTAVGFRDCTRGRSRDATTPVASLVESAHRRMVRAKLAITLGETIEDVKRWAAKSPPDADSLRIRRPGNDG